ncbi:23S rRNA pseudouridine(2605) synthase RluB [Aquabacterium sp.]|uniref:23S rRNA pseudouridine(2605) synthase RluB n=1 Tax=Aquabacterium sp. TaxID=1872578 RepID=UPI00248722EC|nr:pseudouridine synthase [Aquabacterium sp.]MDI1258784.1 pseudouridine synthase [Aquabacterium sp.]
MISSDNAPMQDPNESSPELDPSALNAPEDAPKPKRARRTKAAESQVEPEAEVPVEEVVAKPAPRRRKAAVVAEDVPLTVIEPAVEEAVEAKPKRAPRKKPVQLEAVSEEAPLVREPAGDGFLQLGPDVNEAAPESVLASQEGEQAAQGDAEPRSEERGERGRRDRGPRGPRGDRPARNAAEQAGEQSAETDRESLDGEGDEARDPEQLPSRRAAIAAEQANEVFAELLSGDFDTVRDEAPEAESEGTEADPQKRVLRPEPDAPKLQKVLAQSGVGSRRDIEQMIEDGRITVNGHAAHIGQRVSYGDQVKIGGKPIRIRIAPQPARILAYHKPVGEVVTHDDPQGRPTVFRRLPRLQNGKWMSVGRLDLNTEGLLLFTTSGELANQLMHPRFGVEREYAVRVLGTLPESSKNKLLEGVSIEGQMASFKSIENGGGEGVNHWYRVVITEGRNREVRKLFETVGLAVSRLIRVRYGAIVLPRGLKRGVWVELGESDVRAVKSLAGFDRPDNFQKGGRQEGGRQEGGRNGKPQGGGQQQAPQGQDNFKGRQGGPGAGRGQQGSGRGPQQGQGGYGPQGGGSQGGNQGRNNQNQNRPGRPPMDRPQGGGVQAQQGPQGEHNDDFDNIGPIPNPLEQTFDKRFAKGSKRITQGFGRPDHNADRGSEPKGGPRQPDPLQTSVGYIGADAYFNKVGGRSGRGGGGGGQGGGGGGGNHGGGGGGGGGRGRR